VGFPLVQNDKLNFAFVLLEGLFPDGNLPPEGGSGEGAELDYNGHFGRGLHEGEGFTLYRQEGEVRCHFPGFWRGFGEFVETGRLTLGGAGEKKGKSQEETGHNTKPLSDTVDHIFLPVMGRVSSGSISGPSGFSATERMAKTDQSRDWTREPATMRIIADIKTGTRSNHSTRGHSMRHIKGIFGFWLAAPLLMGSISCADGGAPGGDAGLLATLELEAAYPEAFSYLSGVRELPDGRLLAADPLSQVLLRVDMATGTADTLGGIGGGPGEYQQPDQVFPLPGDSTLLVDIGRTYLTVIGPDGAFHDGMSMALPSDEGPMAIIMPEAVDGSGRIYYRGMGGFGQGPSDSSSVSRYDRSTNTSETVATTWRTEPTITRSGGNVNMSLPRMVPNDDWAVAPDGSVAVIRANGYVVEWYLPDGQVVTGPETPYESQSISYADKEAELEGSSSAGLSISIMRSSSGATEMQMSRGGSRGGGEGPSVEDQEWGEVFPPFREGRSVVSPSNEVWVQRWLPVGEDPRMDVFGSDGVLKGSVLTPEHSQLIGFGQGPGGEATAYFVRADEFDLKWLERYRVVRE